MTAPHFPIFHGEKGTIFNKKPFRGGRTLLKLINVKASISLTKKFTWLKANDL
jgi:hypothetical protein